MSELTDFHLFCEHSHLISVGDFHLVVSTLRKEFSFFLQSTPHDDMEQRPEKALETYR